MKALNGRVIVLLENRRKDQIELAGKALMLDNVFRGGWNAVQVATVIDPGINEDIFEGDKVYVHHFVLEKEHQLPIPGGNYSWLEHSQIFCAVRDGVIFPLSNFVLVEPVYYRDIPGYGNKLNHTLNSPDSEVERIGIVKEVSLNADRGGLNREDKVLFGKSCEYAIEIEGKVYYRMELQDVICVLDSFKDLTIL